MLQNTLTRAWTVGESTCIEGLLFGLTGKQERLESTKEKRCVWN